jgi:small subunit ribosomal protein S6
MFIVKPTLTDEETQAEVAIVKANIEKNDGTIVACDEMGSKNLAYEIDNHKRGYYYVIYFTAPSESISELERNYRVNESIIRFIFIKSESKTEVKHWTAMSEEAAKRSEKTSAK